MAAVFLCGGGAAYTAMVSFTRGLASGAAFKPSCRDTSAVTLAGLNFDVKAPRRLTSKKDLQKLKEEEARQEAKRKKKEEEAAKFEEEFAEEPDPTPVLYSWPKTFQRLQRQEMKPGHLILRRWIKKGKEKGYVTVPFTAALRSVVEQSDVNICLLSRRESSDAVAKEWQKELDDAPLFDVSGEATLQDLDPLEPSWEDPLDELPSDEEVRTSMRDDEVLERMHVAFARDREELAYRASKYRETTAGDANILRQIVKGLPEELRTEDYRRLIRKSVLEVIKTLWGVHLATDAVRLRWRLACTDNELESPSPDTSLRAIFLLAGEGLEFVPKQFVDDQKVVAEKKLKEEQIRRMSSEDWARSVAVKGTNITDALKIVPPGWTVVLKGEGWSGGEGAVYRLPQSGKRVYIEVDFLQGPATDKEGGEQGSQEKAQDDSWETRWEKGLLGLGPLGGFAAFLFGLARKTVPWKAGKALRKEVDDRLRAWQRRPEGFSDAEQMEQLSRFEQDLWKDFGDADEAPAVLVVGGESETGRVVLSKLATSGYHCVLLKTGESQEQTDRSLPQGAKTKSITVDANFSTEHSPNGNVVTLLGDNLYDAVAGVDKLVICDCDEKSGPSEQAVNNVLTAWQLYRRDFAEEQRSFSSKVRIFNFRRDTDFELWDLERQSPSDMCYGTQRVGWTRNQYNQPLFVGQFFEPLGQAQLKSPTLKLNFKRFSGVLLRVYNAAVENKYSFFLRTSDFERTRVQYEFEFKCNASSWHKVRMPFNAFKPVRTDGVPIPDELAEDFEFDRADVVQMGIVVRTNGEVRVYEGERLNYFSLVVEAIKVFRTQSEPQVIYVGRLSETGGEAPADEEEQEEEKDVEPVDVWNTPFDAAEAESEETAQKITQQLKSGDLDVRMQLDGIERPRAEKTPRTTAEAVVQSGLAFTLFKVKDLNEHPGGQYPVALQQAPLHRPHLSPHEGHLKSIARGDVAALVVSALSESNCVNAEIALGESSQDGEEVVSDLEHLPQPLEITSTLQENVQSYLKQLTPNR
eukprot:TRINITY_DN35240_c0_g1_i1.p1 TRINITY_DN35240_c0_g1~~TRINITY_DN35240_c0_g1_i1.p1  ORF type:complete len:1075 (+),score=284.74 TRINITY_DN35240_c0_g1_i1:136-3225(+)